MTIREAIDAADGLRNNVIAENVKRAWLSELDGRIYFEILKPYGKPEVFNGYRDGTPDDTELLVPYPYDSLYISYLEKEIARQNAEMPRYNNASIVWNEKLEAFRRWFVRTHDSEPVRISFPVRRF